MKNTFFFSGMIFLTLLVGCEEVSSNRKKGHAERFREPVEVCDTTPLLRSGIHRERSLIPLTYQEEIIKTLAGKLSPDHYRSIPLIEKDDEGSQAISVSTQGRPAKDCGIGTFAGIDARIANCSEANGEQALWEGARYGVSGEGMWKLVSRSSAGEIWLDVSTGMVWSDFIKNTDELTTYNWCMASGNVEKDTATQSIDCGDLNPNVAICSDLVSDGIGSQIKWRLPTRNDFLQADLDGARFVLKKEKAAGVWTATLQAAAVKRTHAWVYHSIDGTLTASELTTELQVRCIGVPVR